MRECHKYQPQVFDDGLMVTAVTTVLRDPQDLYEVWRDLEQLPRFIHELESVERIGDGLSRWTVRGPADRKVSWDARVTEDVPGRVIAWKSTDGSENQTAGKVVFSPQGPQRGTRVEVTLEYVPPWGGIGLGVSKATGSDARTMARKALHRFRQLMETGEVATTHAQPAGEGNPALEEQGEPRPTDHNMHDLASRGRPGSEVL
jgi:uncharacterized membrane protein